MSCVYKLRFHLDPATILSFSVLNLHFIVSQCKDTNKTRCELRDERAKKELLFTRATLRYIARY